MTSDLRAFQRGSARLDCEGSTEQQLTFQGSARKASGREVDDALKLYGLDSAASSENLLRETTLEGREKRRLLGAEAEAARVAIFVDAEKEATHLIVRAQHHMFPQERLSFLSPDRVDEGGATEEGEALPCFVGELVGAVLDWCSVTEDKVDNVRRERGAFRRRGKRELLHLPLETPGGGTASESCTTVA